MGSRGVPGSAEGASATSAEDQFADDVGRVARASTEVGSVLARLRSPLRVGVLGRRGVGVRTIGAALAGGGLPVTATPDADVRVLVVNEALRDEERAVLAGHPDAIVVLAKADLFSARPDGPLAHARRRAAEIATATGARVVPVVGLLAEGVLGVLDDETVGALRALADGGADLGTVDAFVAGPHSTQRRALLDRLDRFGIARAVTALAAGTEPEALPAILHETANVDELIEALRCRFASARYRRLTRAVTELRCLAIESGDEGLLNWLADDDCVLSLMTAAVHVVEADGLTVDRSDAHERRAVQWRRYGRGPVGPVHRACSADIVRGSLRLLSERQVRR